MTLHSTSTCSAIQAHVSICAHLYRCAVVQLTQSPNTDTRQVPGYYRLDPCRLGLDQLKGTPPQIRVRYGNCQLLQRKRDARGQGGQRASSRAGLLNPPGGIRVQRRPCGECDTRAGSAPQADAAAFQTPGQPTCSPKPEARCQPDPTKSGQQRLLLGRVPELGTWRKGPRHLIDA
jgi:hypothetical protein